MIFSAKYADTFKELDNLLTYLDVMVSLANASLIPSTPYIRPKLLPKGLCAYIFESLTECIDTTIGSGKIEVRQVRHPCLELQEDVSYIPNDCSFDSENRKFYFITGLSKHWYLSKTFAKMLN